MKCSNAGRCCSFRNMIKLFKVKEKQREQAENASNGVPVKKQSAGELRLHKGYLIELFTFFFFFVCFIVLNLCGTYTYPRLEFLNREGKVNNKGLVLMGNCPSRNFLGAWLFGPWSVTGEDSRNKLH